MRPRTVILEAFEDDSTGSVGLGALGMPRDESTNAGWNGATIAHDLIEHVNGVAHIGGIADELEAVGALWFTRGQFGDLSRDGSGSFHTPHENVASDLTSMFRDFFVNGASLSLNAPRTCRVEHDEDLRDILRIAMTDIPREVEFDADDTPELRRRMAEYERVCLPLMRIGYRKAKRRYGSGIEANTLFWLIAEAVQPYLQHQRLDVGMRYELAYGHRDGSAFARCFEHYDEDY